MVSYWFEDGLLPGGLEVAVFALLVACLNVAYCLEGLKQQHIWEKMLVCGLNIAWRVGYCVIWRVSCTLWVLCCLDGLLLDGA